MAPLKRHPALVQLSKDHHFALLLCWKVRKGLSAGIGRERIVKYLQWFWQNDLAQHFREEEEIVLPLLPKDNPLVMRTLQDHAAMRKMVSENFSDGGVEKFAGILEAHVRFEERELFQEIQNSAPPEKLDALAGKFEPKQTSEYADEFWA